MRVARDRRLFLLASLFVLVPLLLTAGYLLLATSLRAVRGPANRQAVPAEEPAFPAGWWQRYTNSDDGYTLALPPEWQIVPLDGQAGDDDGTAVAERLAALAREQASAGLGAWVAVSADGPLGATTSVNVIRQPLDKDLSVEAFAKANLAELRRGDRPTATTHQRWLELSAGRVLCTTASYTRPDGDGAEAGMQATQFFAVHGRSGYVLTAVTRSDLAEAYAPVFEGIVRSLRWSE